MANPVARTAHILEKEPSNYMQTLTQYLSNIMTTVLVGLPTEIKELIYFDALSHAATKIMVRDPKHQEVDMLNLLTLVTSLILGSQTNKPEWCSGTG